MRILFLHYGDGRSNSLVHQAAFAEGLARRGHRCAIAMADTAAVDRLWPSRTWRAVGHAAAGDPFGDGAAAEVVHAWTPREPVRLVFDRLMQAAGAAAPRLVVHLEDHEPALAAAWLALHPELGAEDLDPSLARADRWPGFLARAGALTLIHPSLEQWLPAGGAPRFDLPPILDPFPEGPEAEELARMRQLLGIAPGEAILVYPGGTHFATAPDLADLYGAVALLRAAGRPVRLLRTGVEDAALLRRIGLTPGEGILELGFVPRGALPGLLALADVLVQPGRDSAFNRARLPAKLPEFLATGRPVVLPRLNLGCELQDGEQAVLLRGGEAEDIARAVGALLDRPDWAQRIGRAGREFARRRFAAEPILDRLEAAYRAALG